MRFVQLCYKTVIGLTAVLWCLSLPAQETTESPEELKERIAVERFLQVLEKSPKEGTALERVYAWHVDRGSLDDLCQRLHTRQLEQADGQAALLLGLLQSRRGQDTEARNTFEAAEKLLPNDALASYLLGKCLLLQADVDSATAALQRAVDKNPGKAESLEILKELGRTFQRAKRSADAIGVWKKMEAMFPGDLQVQEQIAAVMVEEGALAEALPRYVALASDTKDRFRQIEFAMQAASLKLKLNQASEALDDFEKLLAKLNPDSWLYQEIGQRIERYYLSRQDTNGLIDYYTQWVDKHPQDISAMLRLGRLLSINNKTDQATGWFNKVIELAPTQPEAYLELSQALQRDGKFGPAATAMEQLCHQVPDNVDHLVRWGELVMADNALSSDVRQKTAAEIWRKLLVNHDDDQVMLARVAQLLRTASQTDEAIQLYRRAIKVDPAQLQYYEYLAEYLFKLKRTDEAHKVWNDLASGPRETVDNLFRRAEVLIEFGFEGLALESFDKACQLRPSLSQRLRYIDKLINTARFEKALEQIEKAYQQANTVDEQDLVLQREVHGYLASGRLSQKTTELEAIVAAPGAEITAAQWQKYAAYLDAGSQFQLATLAIDKAIALQPQSTHLLLKAAGIYERAGNIPQAIETLRKLVLLDRRQQVSLLMQIASLQTRLGKIDDSYRTAKELVELPGASVEHVRYFADLCFQSDKPDEGLAALRKNVRSNPSDRAAMTALAQRLATLYKTDEAIEVTWRALERSSSPDERMQDVQALAAYYQRTGSLKKLMARLDDYGRQSNRLRESIRLKAHAWQATEDYGMARQLLEGLNTDGSDIELLRTLVSIAQTEGDYEAAAKYQVSINRLEPTPAGRLELARYLFANDDPKTANQVWAELNAGELTIDQFQSALQLVITSKNETRGQELTDRVLRDSPNDWEKLAVCAIAMSIQGNQNQMLRICQQLQGLKFPADTLSTWAKNPSNFSSQNSTGARASQSASIARSTMQVLMRQGVLQGSVLQKSHSWTRQVLTSHPTDSTEPLVCMARAVDLLHDIRTTSSLRANGLSSGPLANFTKQLRCFEDVRWLVTGLHYLRKQEDGQSQFIDIPSPSAAQLAQEQSVPELWKLLFLTSLNNLPGGGVYVTRVINGQRVALFMSGTSSGQTFSGTFDYMPSGAMDAARLRVLERLMELHQPEAPALLLVEDCLRLQTANFAGLMEVSPDANELADNADSIHSLKNLERMAALFCSAPQLIQDSSMVDELIRHGLDLEMKLNSKDKATNKLFEAIKALSNRYPSYELAATLVNQHPSLACNIVIETSRRQLRATTAMPLSQSRYIHAEIVPLISQLTLMADRSHVAHLIAGLKQVQAEHVRSLKPAQLVQFTPSARVTFSARNGSRYETVEMGFPPPSALLSSDLIITLYYCQLHSNATQAAQIQQLLTEADQAGSGDSAQRAVDKLTLITWKWWQGDRQSEQECLAMMKELKSVSPSSDLVTFLESSLQAVCGHNDAALALLEGLQSSDPQVLLNKQQALYELYMTTGALDKARQAANQLLKMPLPAQRQLELLTFLNGLGERGSNQDVLKKIQQNSHNSIETQVQLMQQFLRDDKQESAREVAREILRLTRGVLRSQLANQALQRSAQSFSLSSEDTDARQQALRLLANSPEIQQQIADLQERLKQSPQSKSVINELAELYEATGKGREAMEMRQRIRSPDRTSTAQAQRSSTRPANPAEIVNREFARFAADPLYLEKNAETFIRNVTSQRSWDVLNGKLATLDFSVFPAGNKGMHRILAAAGQQVTANGASLIIGKLLDGDQLENMGTFITNAGARVPTLSSDVNQRCLDRILKDAGTKQLVQIFPRAPQENGLLRGPLSILYRLTNEDKQAQRVLDAVTPISQGRPDLKCVQILMLLELGRSKDAQAQVDQLIAEPDLDADCLWELASELCEEYEHYMLAATVLKPIAQRDTKPLDIFEATPKLLLMFCHERNKNFSEVKKLLDEALQSDLSKISANSTAAELAEVQSSLGALAVRLQACGFGWDALMTAIKARGLEERVSDAQRLLQFNQALQHQASLPLQRYESSYESSLTAAMVIEGIGRQADPKTQNHPLSIPIDMLTPTFSSNVVVIDKLNSRLSDKFWWLKQDPNAKSLGQPVVAQGIANAKELSTQSLVALFALAEKLDNASDTLTLAEILHQRAASLPAATESTTDAQLRSAYWILAHRMVAHQRLDLVKDFVAAAQTVPNNYHLHGTQSQLCIAHALLERQHPDEAKTCLQAALSQLESGERGDPNRRLLLTFRIAELAMLGGDHELSLHAFTQAFESGAMQQIIVNRENHDGLVVASVTAQTRGGPSSGSADDAPPNHRKLIFDSLYDVLSKWQEHHVDANRVVDSLIKCVLPTDPQSDIRLVADTLTEADELRVHLRSSRATQVIRALGSNHPYNVRTAEAIQKFKAPQTARYLAFTLIEWASRCGRLEDVIGQITRRLETEPNSTGELVLLYAQRASGQLDRIIKHLDAIIESEDVFRNDLDLLLQAALGTSQVTELSVLPDASIDNIMQKAMTLNLASAAPYCQQRILKAIDDDNIGQLTKLTNLFAECCRTLNQSGVANQQSHHEFLFLNEVTSHCSKANREHLAIGLYSRLQELSRGDKGDARYRHANRAKEAILRMCRLPEARRYEIAQAILLGQSRLTVDTLSIHYLPSSGLPDWALPEEQLAALTDLRPYAHSSTISLLDVLLSGAERRGELDDMLVRLNALAVDATRTQARTTSTASMAAPNQANRGTTAVVEPAQAAKRLLCHWLRLRAENRGTPVPAILESIEQELHASIDDLNWLKYLPEAAQREVFEFDRRHDQLPKSLGPQSTGASLEYFLGLRECMPLTVQQQMCRQPGFSPVALKHWIETDGIGTDGQMFNRQSTWMIAEDGRLLAPANRRCLLLDIPLEGDVTLSLTASVQQPSPKNSFAGLLNGIGIEYRDRTNLAVRDAPVKISHWLSGGREVDLVVRNITKPDETAKTRKLKIERRAGLTEISIDGVLVARSNLASQSFPFVGLIPSGHAVTLSDVHVTGTPVQEVQLLDESLNGWNALRYKSRIAPSTDVLQEPNVQQPPIEFNSQGSDWLVRDGELQHAIDIAEISSSNQSELNASHCYLGYARPLKTGDHVEYEVYCELVNQMPWPCLGHQAMIVDENQIRLHWLPTDNDLLIRNELLTSRGQAADAQQLTAPNIELGTWNKVSVRIESDAVILSLNGHDVYRRPLASDANREFGWYCNPVQSRVRIRNATLHGNWPQSLPKDLWE